MTFPVDAGALQSKGDQLLLKAGHSDEGKKDQTGSISQLGQHTTKTVMYICYIPSD